MGKATAEAILELKETYDYRALRNAWRRLCAEYHPDKAAATGMDEEAANDVLQDINEAFSTLKPLVEGGSVINTSTSDAAAHDSGLGNNEEVWLKYKYNAAMIDMAYAASSSEFEKAGLKFQELGEYGDAQRCANRCFELAIQARKNEEGKATPAQERKPKQERSVKKRKSISGGSSVVLYLLAMVLIVGIAMAIFRFDVFGIWKEGPSQGGSSHEVSRIAGGAPQGVKDGFLYEDAASLCNTEEGKAAVEKGRVGSWDKAGEFLGRVTFGYVDMTGSIPEQYHLVWFPSTGAFESYEATEEVANLAVSQMMGDVDLAKQAFEDSDVWTWTESDITMMERHESFKVGDETWHLKVRADRSEDDSYAFGDVLISERAFNEPSSDGKADFRYNKMRELSHA